MVGISLLLTMAALKVRAQHSKVNIHTYVRTYIHTYIHTHTHLKDWVAGGGEPGSGEDAFYESGSGEGARGLGHEARVAVVAAIYLLRTGLMNCTYPLEVAAPLLKSGQVRS